MIILATGGKWIQRGKSKDRGSSWGVVTRIQQEITVASSKRDEEN